MERVQVVAVYIEQEGKVLLVCEKGQAHGLWSLPMGHVDSDESLEESAVREIKEETGYRIKIIRKLETKEVEGKDYKGGVKDNDKIIELHFFEGQIVGGGLNFNKNDLLDCRWVPGEELAKLPLRGEWLRTILFKF